LASGVAYSSREIIVTWLSKTEREKQNKWFGVLLCGDI
jgi:hypothetical protein